MEKLLKAINKMLNYEFSELEPKLYVVETNQTIGEHVTNFIHKMIILEFNRDGKRIKYRIMSASESFSSPDLKEIRLLEMDQYLYEGFVNNLLFAVGPLNIAEILSGTTELEPEFIR